MKKSWRGVPVIEGDDPIVESLGKLSESLAVGTPVASVAAARVLLAAAENQGSPPTPDAPAIFLMGQGPRRVVYVADGSKTSSGTWILGVVNETEMQIDTCRGAVIARQPGSQHALITSSLPSRAYDRGVTVVGLVNASVQGVAGARILIGNTAGVTARWTTNSGAESVSTINAGIIPAGTDPQIILALTFGGTTDSTVTISDAIDANRLVVQAFPITMA